MAILWPFFPIYHVNLHLQKFMQFSFGLVLLCKNVFSNVVICIIIDNLVGLNSNINQDYKHKGGS
jgi:hypothetical protein